MPTIWEVTNGFIFELPHVELWLYRDGSTVWLYSETGRAILYPDAIEC